VGDIAPGKGKLKPVQAGRLFLLLRASAIAGNLLFILWVLFNAMDSGWKGTKAEAASAVFLIALLATNICLILYPKQNR
jgi:hypothetical protein